MGLSGRGREGAAAGSRGAAGEAPQARKVEDFTSPNDRFPIGNDDFVGMNSKNFAASRLLKCRATGTRLHIADSSPYG